MLSKLFKLIGGLVGFVVGSLLVIWQDAVSQTELRYIGGAIALVCLYVVAKVVVPYIGKKVFPELKKEL